MHRNVRTGKSIAVTAAFALAFLAKVRAIDLLYNKCTIIAQMKKSKCAVSFTKYTSKNI
jgi:hypothetical protein